MTEMQSPPLVSFILPAFKLRFLKEAIDSILNQTDYNLKLIIVNDKSPDDIHGLVKTYNDNRIEYHENKENLGKEDLVASWNHCLQYAKSEYVCLASDDDVYEPFFLSEVKSLISRHPECSLIRGRTQKIDERGNKLDYDIVFPEYQKQTEFVYYYSSHAIRCMANYVYKRDSLVERGGFVSFPCGWFSDSATPILYSTQGVLNTQRIVFHFRIQKSDTVSSMISVPVVKKKLNACQLYYDWLIGFFEQIEDNHCMKSAHYSLRLEYLAMLKRLVSCVPFTCLRLWNEHVFGNKRIYAKEKVEILLAKLLFLRLTYKSPCDL